MVCSHALMVSFHWSHLVFCAELKTDTHATWENCLLIQCWRETGNNIAYTMSCIVCIFCGAGTIYARHFRFREWLNLIVHMLWWIFSLTCSNGRQYDQQTKKLAANDGDNRPRNLPTHIRMWAYKISVRMFECVCEQFSLLCWRRKLL